jgi:hypothetical protein
MVQFRLGHSDVRELDVQSCREFVIPSRVLRAPQWLRPKMLNIQTYFLVLDIPKQRSVLVIMVDRKGLIRLSALEEAGLPCDIPEA